MSTGSVIISHSTKSGAKTVKGPSKWFSGDVYLEMMHSDASGTGMANVSFTPCARTNWHTHEHGQILHVLHGNGWVCDKGGVPRKITAGDVIYAAPGTTHWHGAQSDSLMTHTAFGLGKCDWLDPVTEEEYKQAK